MFKLKPKGEATTAYSDLQQAFGDRKPGLAEVRKEVIEIRAAKGMVIDQNHESFLSAGSFFKNPVVSQTEFDRIQTELRANNPLRSWYWPQPAGMVKVSGAFLISQSGFPKAYKEGHVGISPKQNLALINRGGALSAEIRVLGHKIKLAVKEKFGIELQEEVVYVGDFIDAPQTAG
jgi:UDP-N-acetylmuramate dehydrogenase